MLTPVLTEAVLTAVLTPTEAVSVDDSAGEGENSVVGVRVVLIDSRIDVVVSIVVLLIGIVVDSAVL